MSRSDSGMGIDLIDLLNFNATARFIRYAVLA